MMLGLALSAASMAVLFLSMRAVMSIGGSCAEGGPYAIARPCPDGVAWMLPVSIFAGLIGLGIYAGANAGLPGPRLVLLAWPALFLSLGWNFWDFGLNPPSGDGLVWSWIICGVVFVAMGGLPLLVLLSADARRGTFWADGGSSGWIARRGGTVDPDARKDLTPAPSTAAAKSARPSGSATSELAPSELADALAQVAALHDQGALTDAEFATAKRRILEDSQ